MKKNLVAYIVMVALSVLASESAFAGAYTVYCNTLVQITAPTPTWSPVGALSAKMTSMGYSLTRDAEFRGSDSKQVFREIIAPNTAEALRLAMSNVCATEAFVLRKSLVDLRIPLNGSVSQCAYLFENGAYLTTECKNQGVFYVR